MGTQAARLTGLNLGPLGHMYAWNAFPMIVPSVCDVKAHLQFNHLPREGQGTEGTDVGNWSPGFWQLWFTLGSVHIWTMSFKPQPYVFLTSLKITAQNRERNGQHLLKPSPGQEGWRSVMLLRWRRVRGWGEAFRISPLWDWDPEESRKEPG